MVAKAGRYDIAPKLVYTEQKPEAALKLDLGTGRGRKRPDGFVGVDMVAGKGVEIVTDLRQRWPWKNRTVDEVHCEYLLQYFNAAQRVHFMNELDRVLKIGGKAVVILPHWCSHKTYTDSRAQWPPISESWFMQLNKAWRNDQNWEDDSGYTCDFDHVVGCGFHPQIAVRHQDFQQFAMTFYKEAAQDLFATLTKI